MTRSEKLQSPAQKGNFRIVPTNLIRIFAIALLAFWQHGAMAADPVRIAGAGTVALLVADAAQVLRAEKGMQIQISTAGGTGVGIGALGAGTVDIAMASRLVLPEERSEYPDVLFSEIYVGEQIVALAVSQDVWEAGVHALTRAQIRSIYEGRVTNWREFGGPDYKISFFNCEEGRGTWEIFAQWVYGDAKKAPLGRFAMTASDEEARNTVEFTPGAMAQLSPIFVDGQHCHALEIRSDDLKQTVAATPQNVAAKTYPLARSMYLVVNDKPTLAVKTVVDFMLSERIEPMFKKRGFYSAALINALEPAKP